MVHTHLVFNARLTNVVCGFTNYREMSNFVATALNVKGRRNFDALPTIHPGRQPIPTFVTEAEAWEYFKFAPKPGQK